MAAAADLTHTQQDLTDSFQKTYPRNRIRFVISASGALAQQIENGATYDVFLSANESFVSRLAGSGKLRPDSVVTYATGRLGMLWRDGKTHPLQDLTKPEIRYIAIPNPKLAPYGVAARQALEHEGLWQKIEPKIVYAENARQALQMTVSGNADAVLTSWTMLMDHPAVEIPPEWHQPIRQAGGIVTSTSHLEQARQFMTFLMTAEGQRILAKHGLHPAGKP